LAVFLWEKLKRKIEICNRIIEENIIFKLIKKYTTKFNMCYYNSVISEYCLYLKTYGIMINTREFYRK
jgi:hypothetical protein